MSQKNDKPDVLKFLGIDPAALKKVVEGATTLDDNQQLFEQLASVVSAKRLVESALEGVEAIESDAKGLINAKAKVLYGNDWQAIQGPGYKINRQFYGSVYELVDADAVADEFLKVKIDPDTKAIENYREAHDNALPEGVAINENRTEAVRVKVDV